MRALLLVVVLVVAGCVSSPTTPTTIPATTNPVLLSILEAAPVPAVDGEGVLVWLDAFVTAHSPRLTGTPGEKQTGDDLAAQLKKLGYTVEDRKYGRNGLPSVDGPIRAVVGLKTGTTQSDRMIVLGAHYDTAAAGTGDVPGGPPAGAPPVQAAYDNGAGTAMIIELARLMAQVKTNKTIAFVLFNGEEEGLWGSDEYVKDLQTQGATVDAYIGFDMVGINWPSEAGCLCIYAGEKFANVLNPIQETVAFDFLKYPRSNETVQVLDNHKTRNSDEASFQSAGYPTMRWAGLKSAGLYWAYHKTNDTIETMVKQAGSRELLVQGMETTSMSAYYTLIALDASRLDYAAK